MARRLLRRPGRVGAALVFAFLSAAGLGVGLLAIQPVLEVVLAEGQPRGLPELLTAWHASGPLAGRIPRGLIDAVPSGAFNAVAWMMGGLGVLTLLGATANFLHQYFALTAVQETIADLRQEVFEHIARWPLARIVRGGSADAVSRVIGDTEALAGGLTALLSKAVAEVTKGAAAYAAALVINWKLTLAATLVAPPVFIVLRKLGKRIRRASRKALSGRADLFRAANETMQGLRVVKVHGTEAGETARFASINRDVLRQNLRVRTARAIASPITEVIGILVLGGLTLVAVKAILDGELAKTDFVLALGALGVAAGTLKPIAGMMADIQASSAAADRLADVLAAPPEAGSIRAAPALPALPRHTRDIRFEGVRFTYPEAATEALRGVDLPIPFGSTVAFVGPNGCGKTTLLSMVPRLFEPAAGRVLIDGVDIAGVDLHSLRDQIGVVTQETVLFRRTVRENVAYGRAASDEAVRDALRRARADDIVAALPHGLDTELGEQGLTLSGGQRQRLAIARAILRDPAVLILDEATSMIDAESEARIGQALRDFARGRTCLVVAHRLSTVVNADRIVVMNAGQIVDTGTHAELLERCPLYQDLARHQLVAGTPREDAHHATPGR
jgi:ABC-type multidrug transport system fused ATPase/permease subunit